MVTTKSGTLHTLRVNERGDRFGGPTDNITAEVIVQLTDDAGAYGFRLLDDDNRPVRQGYLDLLRDALNHGHKVHMDVDIDEGKLKGIIKRLWLTPRPRTQGDVVAPRRRPMVVTQHDR